MQVPLVTDIQEFLELQAGIEGNLIRGGGLDQTSAIVDGLQITNNRTNEPLIMTNLSAMKELSVTKGGFNAEYGNVRSGLINIVTKEGSPRLYHGLIDVRYSPAHLKHSGSSVYSKDNYNLRPYLDPQVAFVGTANGWDEETQKTYPFFAGWDAISAELLADSDPTNDRTPQECYDLFMYQHYAEGSSSLGQIEGEDGENPDWNIDASFGGPVPFLNEYLGDLSFFVSHRTNWESYAIPLPIDYYKTNNTQLKLTSRLSPAMKLNIEGAFGSISSFNMAGIEGAEAPTDDFFFSPDNYDSNDMYQLRAQFGHFDIDRYMAGISFDHVLNPSTFYNVRFSVVHVKNLSVGSDQSRDTTTVRSFGATPVDNRGWQTNKGPGGQTAVDGLNLGGPWWNSMYDSSEVTTINLRVDLTSQWGKYNQIKTGIELNFDDLSTTLGNYPFRYGQKSEHDPFRIGAYIQDKLEFEGMIANFGLRFDYSSPNTEWYDLGPYSDFFKREFRDNFTEIAPRKSVDGNFKVSPRLGISHPISENAKLYFNYGHFYSMTFSKDLYRIGFEEEKDGVTFIGNPDADIPKTISYELGFDYDIANMFLLHAAGFYKDVSSQTFYEHVYYLQRTDFNAGIQYTNFDGSVDYSTIGSNNYADIRGFELSIDKRFGKWITGWINYNYIVTTQGYTGRQHYFQDLRLQQREGLMNPYQEKPVVQPFLRSNIRITSPLDFGPDVAGFKPLEDLQLNLLFTWKSGDWMTWDPTGTGELQNNLQWRDRYSFDFRISKGIRIGKYKATLFADIRNVFNIEDLSSFGFADAQDSENYFKSLHLPMYSGAEYQAEGLEAGDDKPGDVKSADKPYIDMPNKEYLWYLNPTSVYLGFRFEF
jgi:hypothetical protein